MKPTVIVSMLIIMLLSMSASANSAGTLAVDSTPPESDVYIDDVWRGMTDATATLTLKVTPGDHNLKIEKPGYDPYQRTISINSGTTLSINAVLTMRLNANQAQQSTEINKVVHYFLTKK